MAALIISISSDVLVKSVGSSFPRVILIGSISVEVPVAPEIEAAAVASPVRVLELDTHSSSEVDPSESSPPPVSVAPMVSPFLGLDDSESDTEIPERHVSPTTSTPEIPTAPILPAPSTTTAPSSEEDISIGRLYRTHPGGPCRALTARKSVRPLPSHRLALRYILHHLDHFTSGSSSSHSSLNHSSFGHSISGHSLFGHRPPDTTDADSSTPPNFVHPSLARTLPGDSSSESSVGPSRKRCRSLAATVTLFIHATRALVPSCVDILPPRKRFRDSISPEDIIEEDIDTDVLEDIKADVEVEDEVVSSDRGTVVVGIDIPDAMLMPDVVEHLEQSRSVIAGGERASLLEQVASLEKSNARLRGTMMMERARADTFRRRVIFMESELRQIRRFRYYDRMRFRRLETFANMTITRSGMTPEAIKELVNRRVEEALAAYEVTRAANALEAENQSQNGSDGDNGNGRNENPNENDRDPRPVARECIYQDFMKCQPLNFKGIEGVAGLIQWFEKMETVFHIRNCLEKYQVKYSTCTLLNSALTWWNSHKRTIGDEAAFAMSWRELMKLMAERFQELTMMCTKMVPEEEDQVEKFIGGLPDNIQGNVIAIEPTGLQDVVRIANNLIDQKPNVRGQNVARAYTAGNNERKPYNGSLPLYNKCKHHHEGPCTVRCKKCNKVGHLTRDCKVTNFTTSTKRGQVVNQMVVTCFECGRQGHYMSDCPNLKDKNHGNKTGNKNGTGEARGKAYVLGGEDANPDSNVVKGTFLLNNYYASMIFDSDTNRSFLLTTFSTLLDVTPDTLDVSYAVELVDERISKTNTVLRGCMLGLLGHPLNIDLMPVELGSFDIIIGMD
ncbi:reverse transcriptase domain-containing protein [Tanacetum coccineum]